jgi:hypothetical protein
MLTRRLFLGGLLAAATAPAIVRSGVLMPVRPAIILPPDTTVEVGRGFIKSQMFRRAHILNEDWLQHFGRPRELPKAIVMHDTRTIVFRRPALHERWR